MGTTCGGSSLTHLVFLLLLSCYCTGGPYYYYTCDAYPHTDTIKPTQALGYQERLVSAQGSYILGFFQTEGIDQLYLGIWSSGVIYSMDDRVWVANRNNPIPSSRSGSANLTLDSDGVLRIRHAGGGGGSSSSPILLNDGPDQSAPNSVATLEDSGNFVLTELNPDGSFKRILWQTFDYPCNTVLPGMKIGVNFKTGHVWSVNSWLTEDIPATGAFTLEWVPTDDHVGDDGAGGGPGGQYVLKRRGDVYWASGPFNKETKSFEFIPNRFLVENDVSFEFNENESYYTHGRRSPRWKLGPMGVMMPMNGQANVATGALACNGYHEAEAKGCAAPPPPECRKSTDYFKPQLGSFSGSQPYMVEDNSSLGLSDCMVLCLGSCPCVGFHAFNANQTGCALYSINGSRLVLANSAEKAAFVYVLVTNSSGKNLWIWIIIAVVIAVAILLLALITWHSRRKLLKEEKNEEELLCLFTTSGVVGSKDFSDGKRDLDVKIFSFPSIVAATNDFSPENKLAEGGFGPVFKGKLPEGQEIAVKRLSQGSDQGVLEFKNEILLIARLQHRNLVRLLGCCINGDEKMLIYEFMPNKSLDFFLFDPTRRGLLNWKMRYNIIEGITQGILYLHRYSRVKIIHRDLKTSNILLDGEMNPKISDFGMARIFGRNDTEHTRRVVGTYGYMSPEYAMAGIFSEKSDIYSFGIILFEILSGQKNNNFYHHQRSLNLAGYAWELWKENMSHELVDTMLTDSYPRTQMQRIIQVGLLCVQESPGDRPTMSLVVSMLCNESIPLPIPNQPAFSSHRWDKESCSGSVSFTAFEPR